MRDRFQLADSSSLMQSRIAWTIWLSFVSNIRRTKQTISATNSRGCPTVPRLSIALPVGKKCESCRAVCSTEDGSLRWPLSRAIGLRCFTHSQRRFSVYTYIRISPIDPHAYQFFFCCDWTRKAFDRYALKNAVHLIHFNIGISLKDGLSIDNRKTERLWAKNENKRMREHLERKWKKWKRKKIRMKKVGRDAGWEIDESLDSLVCVHW